MKNLAKLLICATLLVVCMNIVHSSVEELFMPPSIDLASELSAMEMDPSEDFIRKIKDKFTNIRKIIKYLQNELNEAIKTRPNIKSQFQEELKKQGWPIELADYYCNIDYEETNTGVDKIENSPVNILLQDDLCHIWIKHILNTDNPRKYVSRDSLTLYFDWVLHASVKKAVYNELDKETDVKKLQRIVKQFYDLNQNSVPKERKWSTLNTLLEKDNDNSDIGRIELPDSSEMSEAIERCDVDAVIDLVDDIELLKNIIKKFCGSDSPVGKYLVDKDVFYDTIATLYYLKKYSKLIDDFMKDCDDYVKFNEDGICVGFSEDITKSLKDISLSSSSGNGEHTSLTERGKYCIDLVTELEIAVKAHKDDLSTVISEWKNGKACSKDEACYHVFKQARMELLIFYTNAKAKNCQGYDSKVAKAFKDECIYLHEIADTEVESYETKRKHLLLVRGPKQFNDIETEQIRVMYKLIFALIPVSNKNFDRISWMKYWGKSGIEKSEWWPTVDPERRFTVIGSCKKLLKSIIKRARESSFDFKYSLTQPLN